MKLYEINKAVYKIISGEDERCINSDGEFDIELAKKLLSEVNLELESAVENIACFIKQVKYDAIMLKTEEEALNKRRKAKENQADRLTDMLKYYLNELNIDKIETARAKVKLTRREGFNYDEEKIPEEWYRTKTDVSLDKIRIKEAFKAGELIPGVTKTTEQYITIK